jgi:pyruvate/2-oxoglutarate dehydrogenase complex dihydrolipoamide acyltransferase (E2) component
MHSIYRGNAIHNSIRSMVEYEVDFSQTVSLIAEVDLSEIEKLRARLGAERPSYTALVVKALALALKDFPYANQRIVRARFFPLLSSRIQKFDHSDIAVATERDLPGVTNVASIDILRNAETLSLLAINGILRKLAQSDETTNENWRKQKYFMTARPRWLFRFLSKFPCWFPKAWTDYRGGAAVVSSPAKYGADALVTSWSWPIGASFGFVKDRPVVRDGKVVACPTFNLILNFDRRIMAGAQAGRFFARFKEYLESPQLLTSGLAECDHPPK